MEKYRAADTNFDGLPERRAPESFFRVNREIPLPWLLGIIGAILLFATTQYFTQQRQGELLMELKLQMAQFAVAQSTMGSKAQERDFEFINIKQRVQALEQNMATKR